MTSNSSATAKHASIMRTFRQPRFDRTGNREETFDQRRDRARSLPADYADGWARFITELIQRDASNAAYFACEFWAKTPWGANFMEVAARMKLAGQFAALDMFTKLNPSSLQRIPASMAVAAILLPAKKRDGVAHVHAFLRIPKAARPDERSRLTIQEGGVNLEILAPKAVVRFAAHLRALAHGPSSLHFAHDKGGASNLGANPTLLAGNLAYLTKPGAELRSWDQVELVPHRAWRQIRAHVEMR